MPLPLLISEDGVAMSETTVRDLLQGEQELVKATLSVSLDHPTTKGDHTEGAWIRFLRSFLPSKYAVSKGFVFDSKGNKSSQLDVIIFDPFHSPLIYTTETGETYVTRESVYAAFECKQDMSLAHLEYANDKVKSVIRLSPTSRAMFSCGVPHPPRDAPRIIGGLLTSRGSLPSADEKLKRYDCLDVCVSVKDGTALIRRDKDGVAIGVSRSGCDDGIPALYFTLLDLLHKMGTVPAIDIREYAKLCIPAFHLPEGD